MTKVEQATLTAFERQLLKELASISAHLCALTSSIEQLTSEQHTYHRERGF